MKCKICKETIFVNTKENYGLAWSCCGAYYCTEHYNKHKCYELENESIKNQ